MLKLFEDIIKDQPSVGDVHIPTALDDEDDEDVVKICVTKDGGIAGFDGRRLEPLYNTLIEVELPVNLLCDKRSDLANLILNTIVNRKNLTTKSVLIKTLTFPSNQILRSEVEKDVRLLADGSLEQPLIAKVYKKDFVITGASTILAHWLNGEERIAVQYCDFEEIEKCDDALKITFKVEKTNPDQQMIFGWASVVTKNGKPIVDKQGHIIPIFELEKAFYEYVRSHRVHGHMHKGAQTGELIECMVFTKEKQELLNMDLGFEGAWVGYLVNDPTVWAAHKRGELPEFSIGGFANPVDI